MPRVFDVAVVLDHEAPATGVAQLFKLLEERSIRCVALETPPPTGRQHELRFAIYGEIGQFIASHHVVECVGTVFQTDLVAVNQRM